MAPALTIFRLLLFLVSFGCSCASVSMHASVPSHLAFSLTHRDAERSPLRSAEADPVDLPQYMPMRDFVAAGRALKSRLNIMKRGLKITDAKLSYAGESLGEFYLTAAVGTPPQSVIFVVDTGSEFCWAECSPCLNCTKLAAPIPRFAYKKSSSFRAVGCESPLCLGSVGMTRVVGCNISTVGGPAHSCIFRARYGDGSTEAGFFSVDSFHLPGSKFTKALVFGCATIVEESVPLPNTGLLGFDAGPFSFPSQLFSGSPGMARKFAYCLPDRISGVNAAGRLELGNYKRPMGMRYTPLAAPYGPLAATFYYADLKGITVGRSRIKVVESEGVAGTEVAGGGTIFDSGTALTQLAKGVYNDLVGELRRQTLHLRPFNASSNGDLDSDLCYKLSAKATELPNVPTVSLHFAGAVDLELGPGSVLYPTGISSDHASAYVCLAFTASADSRNIIGNYQQQNHWVEYNLDTFSLGLAKAKCTYVN